jgi:ribosomal-protein-alanine N-acetyltransferase
VWHTRLLTLEDARTICRWQYPAPLDLYNATDVDAFLEPQNHYHAVLRGDALAGFFCLGADARVPGGKYSSSGTDLGLGMRPELTGQGLGRTFFRVILEATQAAGVVRPLRLTVAAFNERAIHLYEAFGFRVERHFTSRDGLEFLQMTRHEPEP